MTQEDLDYLLKTLDSTDDSDKVIQILKNLKLVRDVVCQKKKLSDFSFGEIVLDLKNKEVGIVIGPFVRDKEQLGKSYFSNDSSKLLYLIVTHSEDSFRVRYVRGSFLKSLNLEVDKNLSINDLQYHCESQCIMECSSDCSLWKYSKKKG